MPLDLGNVPWMLLFAMKNSRYWPKKVPKAPTMRRPRGGVKHRAKRDAKLHREHNAMQREDQLAAILIDKEESDEALLLPLLPRPHSFQSPSSFVGVVCGIREVEDPQPQRGAGGGIKSWPQAGGGGD